ncbi:MAG: hypothetical protein R3181_01115 [Rubricoccaceae bacterium]|nr:hypothetical protein [Rubricoccaceae bacterium]
MNPLRARGPLAYLLFAAALLLLIGLPALCAIDRAVDPETPPDTDTEAVPDLLQ